MVYCQNCGKELDETKLNFCSNCGTPITVPQPNFESQPPIQSGFDIGSSYCNLPMKWFNFLIYFGLFVSAFANTVAGFQNIFTPQYFVGLKILNILYGLCAFGFAAFAIITRFALASYKRIGPELLYKFYALSFIINITYYLFASIIVGANYIFSSTAIASYIGTGLMLYFNRIYFTKRSSMFTN